MLEVGVSEIKRAFIRHRSSNATTPNPLLLFYAVECGLKLVWMKRNRVRNTSYISPDLKQKGHDLDVWVKNLRLPRVLAEENITFRLKAHPNTHPIGLSHQAWRYGAEIITVDQNRLVQWLEKIGDWVAQEEPNQ